MEAVPILGIFDSGVGGFSVYREIKRVSQANCIYYGDCLRAPYGNRKESEIVQFIKDDITFLQEKDVTHFVNACNSMSVFTTDRILKECDIDPRNYIDMIRAFDAHASFHAEDKILVLATQATIRSNAYQEVLTKKGVEVFEYAYADLAEAVEINAKSEVLVEIIARSIVYAKEVGATHIIYGCTHYPIVHQLFVSMKEKYGWVGEFIDPAIYVAVAVKSWNLKGERALHPYSSKDTPAFINNVIRFL